MMVELKNHEQGFALVEVLIATAIAAMVAASIATGLSLSLRGARAVEQKAQQLEQATTILARLKSGMDEKAALAGFDQWKVEITPIIAEPQRRTDTELREIVLQHQQYKNTPYTTLIIARRSP